MKFQCLLTIHGRDLNPDEVTKALRVSPIESGRRGERITRGRSTYDATNKLGVWMLRTNTYVKSDDLALHVSWLIETVQPERVLSLPSVDNVTIAILWHMIDDSEEIELPSELLGFAFSIGARITIDAQFWGNKDDVELVDV